jgi:hypothetical protein
MTSIEIEHRINPPPDYDQVYIGRRRLLVAMGYPTTLPAGTHEGRVARSNTSQDGRYES